MADKDNKAHPAWPLFAMWANSHGIGIDLSHEEDYWPWWDCFLQGYNEGARKK